MSTVSVIKWWPWSSPVYHIGRPPKLTAPETISRSRDMLGAHQNLYNSRDLTTLLSAVVCHPWATINLPTTFKLSTSTQYYSPVAGHITLLGPLTIVSLLFSVVLSVLMKFSPGGRWPPAWLFQNPRWPPRWPPRTYKSMILHIVRSKYSIIALLVLIIMF